MAITDLTNTKWQINAGWSATSGYGRFSITGITDASTNYPCGIQDTFDIGYVIIINDEGEKITPNSGVIGFWKTDGAYKQYYAYESFTLEITGGTDATNTNLISWLESNATLLYAPSEESSGYTLRVNGKTLNLLNGKKVRNLIYKGTTYEIKQPSVDTSGYTLTLIAEYGAAYVEAGHYSINGGEDISLWDLCYSETRQLTIDNVEKVVIGTEGVPADSPFVPDINSGIYVGSTAGGKEYGELSNITGGEIEIVLTQDTTIYLYDGNVNSKPTPEL